MVLPLVIAGILLTGSSTRSSGEQDRSGTPATASQKEIAAVIDAQKEAWNQGNIDEFMSHYLPSEELTFSSGGKVVRGWKATRQRYHDRYPTPKEMGEVNFTQLEITLLGDAAALVLGNWQLKREQKPVGGNFSIVFRRIDGRWLIIHDHTSVLME